MVARYEYLQGKAKWAKLVTPDTKFGDAWKVQLYLNDASYQKMLKLKEEGVLNNIYKDEDGYFVNLKRPTSILLKGNRPQALSPPEIMEADGKTPLRNALIGNGSDITVKLDVYKYRKATDRFGEPTGIAIRLRSVRVDNLVPFEMKRDFTTEQQRTVKGLDEQPPQVADEPYF